MLLPGGGITNRGDETPTNQNPVDIYVSLGSSAVLEQKFRYFHIDRNHFLPAYGVLLCLALGRKVVSTTPSGYVKIESSGNTNGGILRVV